MSKSEIAEGMKSNWYLLVIAGVCLVAGLVMAVRGGGNSQAEATASLAARPEQTIGGPRQQATAYADPARLWKKPSVEATAHADLQRYQDVLTNNPDSEEAALAVARSANVYYTKLGDYDQAASQYERLLSSYPDYKQNLHGVYSNLGACYERMGNRDMARSTYERMRDHFGPGTHEYVFASERLRRL